MERASNQPEGSKVILIKQNQSVYVEIPPPGWKKSYGLPMALLLVWLGGWTTALSMLVSLLIREGDGIFVTMIFFMFWVMGLSLLSHVILLPYTSHVLHIGQSKYGIWKERHFNKNETEAGSQADPDPNRVIGDTCELDLAKIIVGVASAGNHNSSSASHIQIREGVKTCAFGYGLADNELEWILEEVNGIITKLTCTESVRNQQKFNV